MASRKKLELLWKQRAKAHWLKQGDRNIVFFYAKTSEKKQNKVTKALKDDLGNLEVGDQWIRRIIIEYFGNIFHSTKPNETIMKEILETVDPRVM
ncbi:UNVERIFIED_CONTAM: hypothetical protein Sradi_0204200 [Sesamum radiatum]|uniref:Uncharacterized protein n=1 Tax=Sesamum radiatum TaxID=300843 RepID=A0AAW2W0R4_SESRA